MSDNNFKIVFDQLGYRRLDPIPQTGDYYRNGYHESLDANRAPDIRRAIDGGEDYERDKAWLADTLWHDIREIGILCIHQWIKGYHFLDFGCGTGDFCVYMQNFGWEAEGVEISSLATDIARKNGITIYSDLAECGKYDLISAVNVLEHVPNPQKTVLALKEHLAPGGVLAIQVPNDFSPLQQIVKPRTGNTDYWVVSPDHINYFNFPSLYRLAESCGMQVVYRMTSFPMEWFILWGDNYILNPGLGSACHRKRMEFDLALSTEDRRMLYAKLSELEWGRHCIVFAVEQSVLEPQPHIPFDWIDKGTME